MSAEFFAALVVSLQVGAFQRILKIELLVVLGVIVLDAVEAHQVFYELVVEFQLFLAGFL